MNYWNAPTDSVLPLLVSAPRALKRRRTDTLWLCIDDIPATLAARRYARDGVLRLDVDGQRVDLHVDDGVARCGAGDGRADLRLGKQALGAIYLGGTRPSLLARAGLVEGETALAEAMFATPVAPWIAEIF